MRRLLIGLICLSVLSGGLFAGGSKEPAKTDEKPLVLKAAHSMPTTYHYHDGMTKFADEAARLSNGKIKIEIFPAAQLGEEVATMEQCKIGAIPIVLTGVSDSYVPKTGAFILPFLFANGEHADKVLNGPIGKEVYSDFSKHNIIVLSIWENGFRQITNNKRPINSIADMPGLKIRTPQSPVYMDTMKAFGVTPTPMPFAETATAIVQGLVDGQENALLHIKANKTYEVQKYIAVVDYMYGPAPLLVNKPLFDKMSDANKKALVDAAAEANKHMRKVAADRNKEAITFFEQQGIKVTYPDKAGFLQKVQPLYEGMWAEKFGKDLLEKIKAAK
jgi:TRAP-type transport system periplasmic protein